MGFFTDRILLTLFIFRLKTKRIVKSAISGKINYYAKSYAPFVIGSLIVLWALFIYFL